MSESRKLEILVSGAGIAGLTAAYFLLQAGHKVTVVERALGLRASGQSVDVRGHALTILQHMPGVEEQIKSKITNEKGLKFVDANDVSRALFPVDDGSSFTGTYEIQRGDLAGILYTNASKMPGFEALFGHHISSLDETENSILVSFEGRGEKISGQRPFDLVIAADGISSSTRTLAFGPAAEVAVKPLGQWSCWFSIPPSQTDAHFARWYNATKGRMILVRPDSDKVTRASLWIVARDAGIERSLADLSKSNLREQKKFWSNLFSDVGWEAQRVLKGLEVAEDFHMQQIAQVKLEHWFSGRVVLVGDAGYCPSPVSGMGVTTAMTGAYTLAGEINSSPQDLKQAFNRYEQKLRPFVVKAQELAPGTPGAANPETALGIWLLHCFLGFIAWTKLYKLLGSSINPPSAAMELSSY